MSTFTPVIVQKPRWFRIAPIKHGWGKRPPYVLGFDSEAYKGAPFLLQFSLPEQDKEGTILIPTTPESALEDFISFLEPIAHDHARTRRIVTFGWNLRYEYTQLFRNLPSDAWDQSSFQLHFHERGECDGDPNDDWSVMIDAMNEKRYAFTINFGGHADNRAGRKKRDRYPIRVIDGMAFLTTSLDKAAGIVGVEGKVKMPDTLKGNIKPSDFLKSPRWVSYAKQDAWITRKVGETIVGYHTDYDVPLTISAPMFASHVFRRKFLEGEIPLCFEELEDAGLKSYHGGKNGLYIDRPMYYADAYDYDLNAAYTAAMSALPDPVNGVWEEVHRYEPDVHGIFYVIAKVRSCTYRAFQETNGRWHTWRDDGDLGFWITSYELDEAMRHGEVLEVYECSGFILRGDAGIGSLKRYCDEMSWLKAHGATAEIRAMAKLCLNALYGKFVQKVPNGYESIYPMFDLIDNEDGTFHHVDANMVPGGYRAGGLYHPALASLITGRVRATVHGFEHKYASLMTSTDGFLSLVPPDNADIGPHVGGLKVKRGRLHIWRERLYLFENDEHDGCDHDQDKYECRVMALHGFRGKLDDLRGIPLVPGKYDYRGRQMVGLRESKRKHDGKLYRPGEFADLPYQLDLTTVAVRAPIRTL